MNKATQLSSQNNTLNLDIEGMTCAACAARIERVISKQENYWGKQAQTFLKIHMVCTEALNLKKRKGYYFK